MSTNELIDNISKGDSVKANKAFDSVMKTKLNDALNVPKILYLYQKINFSHILF